MNRPPILANMTVGRKCLARYLCAGYHLQYVRIPAGMNAKIYISGGRALPTPVETTGFKAISAERYDMILEPGRAGEYVIEFDIVDWITGKVWGTARTNVVVAN